MKRSHFIEKTYTHFRYRVLAHLLFWLLLFGSFYYFNTISFNPTRNTPAAWLQACSSTLVLAFAFYTLMYAIWPRLLAQKKWLAGIALILLWLIVIATLYSIADVMMFRYCKLCAQQLALYSPDYYAFLQKDLLNIVLARVVSGGLLYQLVFQLSFPVALKIGRSYFRQTVQGLQLEKDNLQLEFNFLKSQVNPHFLFNTLNNIYSLVMAERKEQAAATIARLSGFMRYALYETGDEKILLYKEVRLLQDYVELEKLRLNETEVLFSYNSDGDAYVIPPLLIMPALENAFKYTVDKEGSRIAVDIVAIKGMLDIAIQNNFDPERRQAGGGIGLHNLQRRVQHYYGSKARYTATVVNDVYLFRLSCPLL